MVFFLSITEDYSPIGFISSPAAVCALQWGGEGKGGELQHLLVCCVDGSMMEVEAPLEGRYNTNKSYYLDPLKCTLRRFASIKDRLRVSFTQSAIFPHFLHDRHFLCTISIFSFYARSALSAQSALSTTTVFSCVSDQYFLHRLRRRRLGRLPRS